MGILNTFDPFIESFAWLAIVVIVVLGIWLFGKRTILLKHVIQRHGVLSSIADFGAALVMILLMGSRKHTGNPLFSGVI